MLKIGWSKRDVSTDKQIIIPAQHYIRYSKGVLKEIRNRVSAKGGQELVEQTLTELKNLYKRT